MVTVPLGRLFLTMTQKPFIHSFEINLANKLNSAVAKGLVGAEKEIRDFGQRYKEGFGNPADTEQVFSEVATAMRAALVDSYKTTVEERKVVPSYRQGAGRYSGGALLRALEDPSMAVGHARGISYINQALLDLEAKHWKRLNFGAAGHRVSGTKNARFPAYFDSRILFYAGSRAGLRPGFTLPAGRFIDPRSGKRVPYGPSAGSRYSGEPPTTDRFFPGGGGRGRIIQSGGIEGRHFIDAGFEVLARDFGPAIKGLYDKWIFEAKAGAKSVHFPVDV